METQKDIIDQPSTLDAAQAIAAGHEALELAHSSQLTELLKTHQQETLKVFTQAMQEVLSTGDEGTKRLLIQKIPLLCTDILTMKSDLKLIKKVGGWILLGIGSLFLTLVGSLLLKGL